VFLFFRTLPGSCKGVIGCEDCDVSPVPVALAADPIIAGPAIAAQAAVYKNLRRVTERLFFFMMKNGVGNYEFRLSLASEFNNKNSIIKSY